MNHLETVAERKARREAIERREETNELIANIIGFICVLIITVGGLAIAYGVTP